VSSQDSFFSMSVKLVIVHLVINIILLVGLLPLFKANTFLKTRYCASLINVTPQTN